ncbi:MAG TPA: hypothetical protein VF765_11985 [Polyangiaceae bacterium]
MRTIVGVALVAAAVASCGGGSSSGSGGGAQLLSGFDPGPAPDSSKGFQFITPIVDNIEPGASVEYCTWTDTILQHDVYVDASQGFQSDTGHHIIVYYSMIHQPPDTHLCSNSEMTEFSYGMPGNGSGQKFVMPGNLATKLPAGAQLIVNHHYLNAAATTVAHAQSAINVFYADPTKQHTDSGAMIVLDTELTVPVGASTYEETCTINRPYQAWMEFPHMHAWGTHITVTHTPAATGMPEQLFDLDWDPSYAFDPTPISKRFDPSSPFVFNTGDKINIKCDYMNNTKSAMSFGDEMCVFGVFTVDANNLGNLECDRGKWGAF